MRDDAAPAALTVEFALYAALFCVAAFARLFLLDWAPLNSIEAHQALAAFNFVHGTPVATTGSPLLFTLDAIFFLLFTASDFTARLAPALFGTALVLLPVFFRRDMGRTGALVASALFAFSPSLVFFSRTLDGAIPAVATSLAAIGMYGCYLDSNRQRDLYICGTTAALALLAAPDVWTIALAFALYFLTAQFNLVPGFSSTPNTLRPTRSLVLVFLLIFLTTSTTFILHREGLGAAFDLFAAWLNNLNPGSFIADVLRLLAVYDPLITLFGISAILDWAFGTRQEKSAAWVALVFWIAVAFFLLAFSANNDPARIVVVVAPLALVAGASIGAWVERVIAWARELGPDELLWHEAPLMVVCVALGSFLSIALAELSQRGSIGATDILSRFLGASQDTSQLAPALVLVLFILAFSATAVLAVTLLGRQRAQAIGILVGLIFLGGWTIRQTALLNFSDDHAVSPQEWIVTRAASPNVRDLVRDLENHSRWRANDSHSLVVAVDNSLGPIVQWNLRDFRYAQYADHATVAPEIQARVLPIGTSAPAAGWIAQKYQLEMTRGVGTVSALRALIYRDVGVIISSDAVLWVPPPEK